MQLVILKKKVLGPLYIFLYSERPIRSSEQGSVSIKVVVLIKFNLYIDRSHIISLIQNPIYSHDICLT